jgi:NhaP-type Na+/H+ or K+/H+ antiporter
LAIVCHTYGFLAVFAAGLALRRIDTTPSPSPAVVAAVAAQLEPIEPQASPTEAPAAMMNAVQRFNTQLESFAEVAIVLAVGALLARVRFDWTVLWFVPLIFLVIRPLAVYVGIVGTGIHGQQRRLMAWFGIRGIGSIYYLLYAIRHDIHRDLAERLLSLTIAVVVASVIAHGVSVTPLMKKYEQRKAAKGKRATP